MCGCVRGVMGCVGFVGFEKFVGVWGVRVCCFVVLLALFVCGFDGCCWIGLLKLVGLVGVWCVVVVVVVVGHVFMSVKGVITC